MNKSIAHVTTDENQLSPEEQESERLWDELFARPESQALLAQMAAEALEDYRTGRTEELDPDKL